MGIKLNILKLGLGNIGLNLIKRGYIVVNEKMEINFFNIYVVGDIINMLFFVYIVVIEGSIVVLNVFMGEIKVVDYFFLFWVVFIDL